MVVITAATTCSATFFFGLVNAVYFAALPYPQASGLVHVQMRATGSSTWAPGLSLPDARDIASQVRSLARIGFASTGAVAVSTKDELQMKVAGYVSSGVFSSLGVAPAVGRVFTQQEDREGQLPVVVVSYRTWVEDLGSDSSQIGRPLVVDHVSRIVVGVMPRGFDYPGADLWIPIAQSEYQQMRRERCCMLVLGRLRPSVSPHALSAELDQLSARIAGSETGGSRIAALRAANLRDYALSTGVASLRVMGYVLVGTFTAVAAFSVALLLIARDLARHRDISIAAALGASRSQLVRPYVHEAVIISLVSTVIGLAGAEAATAFLRARLALSLPSYVQLGIDWRVASFAALLSLVTAFSATLLPALRFSRPDIATALRTGGGISRTHPGGLLVSGEIAITLVLFSITALVSKRVIQEGRRTLGYNEDRLALVSTRVLTGDTLGPAHWRTAARTLEKQLGAAIGARDVGIVQASPRVGQRVARTTDGSRTLVDASWRSAPVVGYANPEWFRTLAIQPIVGRLMTDDEDRSGATVAVINSGTAMALFGDQNPIGRTVIVSSSGSRDVPLIVIGVVRGVIESPTVLAPPPSIYSPALADSSLSARFYLRTTTEDNSVVPRLRRAVADFDPDLIPSTVSFVRASLAKQRAVSSAPLYVVAPLAILAALSGAIALFSFVAFAIDQRRLELAIRSALGATSAANAILIGRFALSYVGVGLAVGLFAAIGVSQVGSAASAQFETITPAVLGVALVGTLFVVVVAVAIPLIRAQLVAPAVALRSE